MVEFKIEGRELVLYPNEIISIEIAINDLASIETANGNFSNKFKIPAIASNNEILGYPSKLNFVTGFRPSKSRTATISINGLEVQRGFVQIEQYNSKSKEFNVSFVGGNVDWMDGITDKKLADLDLSQYNHTYNANTIKDSFTNTEGYIYPFINYNHHRTNTGNDTDVYTWLPAMYSHTLVRQMFSDIGWKVGGSLMSDPIFLRHVLPFSVKDLDIQKGSLDELGLKSSGASLGFPANNPIVFPFVEDHNDNGNYDTTTGIYTASGTSSIFVNAKFNFNGNGTTDKLEIRLNGSVVHDSTSNFVSGSVALNPGDTVYISMNFNGGASPFNSSYFNVTPSSSLEDGMGLPMSSTMPDLTQEDFIKTIFNQFGAIFTSDNISKTVYINKFSDIKDNIRTAKDWTSKIDISRDLEIDYTELVSDYSKVNKYAYKENKDQSNNQTSSTEVNAFAGNGSFIIDNDFLSKENEIFESEFVSSSQVNAFNNRIKLMYIPRYQEGTGGGGGVYDPLPRCALIVRDVEVSELFNTSESSINIINSSVGTVNSTSIPFAYFDTGITGVPSIDDTNQSLSFGVNIIPQSQQTLLEGYYNDYISILNTPRRITGYFLLNETDINKLDFLTPIYLGGELNSYFYINKVKDYRPYKSGVTKVELVLIP